jgi:Pyridoxamine 5'-phosphate oxidase
VALRVLSRSRPGTAGYFQAAHAGAGLLDWESVARRFATPRNYWVSTASRSGRPHAMPVWGVWLDDRFVFSTSPASRKAHNLFENPRIAVHLEDADAAIIIEGRAVELRDATELLAFIDAYNPKYDWNFTQEQLERGVFAVQPEQAFAWLGSSGDSFGGSATRWRFEPQSSADDR